MPPARPPRYGLPLRRVEADDITVRKPRPEDAAAIADLLNRHAVANTGEPAVSTSIVAHWLGLPRIRFWIAERGDELAAYADIGERAERTRYWVDLRSVDGEATGELIETIERWVLGRAAADARIFAIVDEPDGATRDAYEQAGYRPVRHAFEMEIDLADEPPEPSWPEGLVVRRFRPGADDARLHQAVEEAFADHWEYSPTEFGEWRQGHLKDPDFEPDLVFLAEDGGEIAGVALDYVRQAGEPYGLVDILGVRRPWRGRGLGLALLHASFGAFRDRGLSRAKLEVDAENVSGAVRLYERAGMHVVKRWVNYEKRLR